MYASTCFRPLVAAGVAACLAASALAQSETMNEQPDAQPTGPSETPSQTGPANTSSRDAEITRARLDEAYEFARMTTNQGEMIVLLDEANAPISVANFLQYAADDAYDGTIFHRVIPNFMIQGGGFTEDMTKLPTREPIKNEWTNGLKNVRGTLAMARLGGQADSATNQFFINVTDNAFLDKPRDGAGYAVFGAVIEGMDVADTIRQTPTQNDPRSRMQNVPIRPMIIEDVTEIEADELSDSAIADAREWMERTEQWVQAAEEAKARQAQRDQMQREQAATFVAEQYGLSMDDLTETDSGLMYATVEEGSGDNPESAAAEVTVHYTGWLTDGTKFDSSRDRGEPAQFPLNRVIPGWTEGVQSMNEGERRVLVIPFSLAYGEQGRPPRIPGRSMLIFDVELIDAGG